MTKIIMIFLAFSLSSFGMSYEKFKKHTLKHSKVLQSKALSLQTTQQESAMLLRTQNPTLDLELSRFNPDFENSEFGYMVSASQNIRTNTYYSSLESKANARVLLQKAYILDGKAGYIKTLEKLYTQYVHESKLLTLLQQEYRLSNKVTRMVKERYENGSETRVAYLQANTETLMLKTQMHTTKQKVNTLYLQLLAIAGFNKNISLEKQFIYSVSTTTSKSRKQNSLEQILLAKEKMLASQAQINESTFESYVLSAGIEQEPDQSILRFNISVPLTLQHNKEEEKTLAKLQMQQLSLDKEQLAFDMNAQKKIYRASIKELSLQYNSLKTLQKEQKTLSSLLTEGYKIAQGSLFQLMREKSRLIQTNKSLLNTQKEINNQKIELRFLQGHYND